MSRKEKLFGSVFDGEIWINDIQYAIEAMAVAVWVQHSFRGRNDDGSETTATWKAATNTNWTQAVDVIFRVRFVSQNTAAVFGAHNPTLYSNHNGAGWNQVSSGSVIRFRDSTNVTNDAATTEQLAGPQSFVAGAIVEDAIAPTVNLTAQDTEFEFVVEIRSSLAADGDTIQLRLQNGTSAYDSYLQVPSITVSETTVPTGTGAGTIEYDDGGSPTDLNPIFGSASGVRGVAGTAAGTVTQLTGSASGVHGVAGSAAGTVTQPTGAASGVHGVTGTAAGEVPAVTGAATGTFGETVEGTGDGTIPNVTGSASGVHGVAGSAAGTVTQPTGAAAGVHGVTGTAAGEVSAVSGSATGLLVPVGTGAGTVSQPTGAAAGVHGVAGSAAGTVTQPTSSASGVHGVQGTAAGTIPAVIGEATGEFDDNAVEGTGAGVIEYDDGGRPTDLNPVSGSASGVHGVAGSAAGTVDQPAGSASGVVGVAGVAAGAVPAVTGASSGVVGVTGTGAGTIAVEGSGSGFLVVQGTGAGEVPAITGSGVGTAGGGDVPGGDAVAGGGFRFVPRRPPRLVDERIPLPKPHPLERPKPSPEPVVGVGAGVLPMVLGIGYGETFPPPDPIFGKAAGVIEMLRGIAAGEIGVKGAGSGVLFRETKAEDPDDDEAVAALLLELVE